MRPDPSLRERKAPDMAYSAVFSAGLLDPDRETPSHVSGPAGKAAAKRYNVYRNNVTVSLIDALAAVYPAVQRITGVEFFRAMARLHVRETPPTSPLLFEYGRDFPAFVERYEYAQGMPWLSDAARIERAWLDAYHAADAAPLTASGLASVPAERLADLVLAPHPATRLVRSRFAAVTIVAANRAAGPVEKIDASQAEDALITRPECDVVLRRLAPGQAEFLSALISGRPLGEAAGAALEHHPGFNVGAGIATLIETGAFISAGASASIGDNP
ncbi:DNA-binding domain-containing protein [uncultured Rhodoblastus sp.]|uniref:HvfC/BufC N-terminal domain-containing protein n=1 Tax=uncultured Rhodoblastus sp. TaxID=543037 RepID=UPI0025CC91DE|nr:DNA-binding domain-containing protein [uncultured Rhodoblastus sp.]